MYDDKSSPTKNDILIHNPCINVSILLMKPVLVCYYNCS